jgi:hypothetical protein
MKEKSKVIKESKKAPRRLDGERPRREDTET